MTADELKKLPKIELHCHLDGSLSKSFIQTRLGRTVSEEELSVNRDCRSLVEYLEKFALPGECLMDEAGLEDAGYDVLQTMSHENVIYAEIRFAPLLSVTEEMRTEQVIAALLRGLEKGKKEFGVAYNVITCAMRHHSEEENFQMIKTARQFLGEGVCAADLAGAEAQYPMTEFMDLFGKTKQIGMPFTLHAGECGEAQNIVDSVKAGAKRIGHGIAMRGRYDLQKMVREAHVGIEMCPISNLQTKAVENASEYPLREFLDAGILVSVNTDNRTVSSSSLTKELEFIQSMYGIRDDEILLLMRNAAETAFVGEEMKHRLYQKLKAV
ncbi:MAG: adenosine deaminase [Blautia sp.]